MLQEMQDPWNGVLKAGRAVGPSPGTTGCSGRDPVAAARTRSCCSGDDEDLVPFERLKGEPLMKSGRTRKTNKAEMIQEEESFFFMFRRFFLLSLSLSS